MRPRVNAVKIALLQINPLVGDLAGNARLIADARARGRAARAPTWRSRRSWRSSAICRAICCSARPSSRGSWDVLADAGRRTRRPAAGARRPAGDRIPSDDGPAALQHRRAAARTDASITRFRKALLPTYDVFDEDRYFEPFHGAADPRARRAPPRHQHLRGRLERSRLLEAPPLSPRSGRGARSRAGADAIVNLSASPFSVGKQRRREEMLGSMARKHRVPVRLREPVRRQRRPGLRRPQLRASAPTARRSRAAARSTRTSSSAISTPRRRSRRRRRRPAAPKSEIWRALVLGTRDYVAQVRLRRAVLGLSGRHRLGADRRHRRRGARRRRTCSAC